MIIFPDELDITLIEDYLQPTSIEYFKSTISKLNSQHIYENKKYDWKHPKIIFNKELIFKSTLKINFDSLNLDSEDRLFLVSNRGGKDSFMSMKLINDGGFKFSFFTHARSEYGRYDFQFQEQNRTSNYFIKQYNSILNSDFKNHEILIHDDFTDGVFAKNNFPDYKGECFEGHPCQTGFPEMIFYSLPFVLLYGYSYFVLGNENPPILVK